MNKITKTSVAAGVAMALAAPLAAADVLTYDVTGTDSWDLQGDSDNTVVVIDVAADLGLASGSSVTLSALGWDVVLSSVGASWLSEMTVTFNGEISITPGAGDDLAGISAPYSSGGLLDLTDNALDDIILSDGLLTLEFWDSYEDGADAIDGMWDSGTLSYEANATVVPVPAALPLFMTALGGLLFGARRRRQS